ncbi:AAA family ATPase [Nonomuraea sp. NPDC048826]|uniref:helix-turn-helix transcriptional regulator n=1 Tax=Nonomuraea sp. NPDC048826 TaxID=3364347 RepID=UPI003717D739
MLFGREREQIEIDRLLSRVRGGGSGALYLWGDPGIGKTALLDYAADRADRIRVLRITGVEGEAELAYAALHMLLLPALDRIGLLAGPQADALKAALGLASGSGADRFLIGLATLTLLDDLAGSAPLLCLVDDAQWLDSPSAETLLFVARRLQNEGIGLIFAARPGFAAPGVPELPLGDLDRESASLILDRHSPRLPWHLRDRVLADSEGNPLALLELPALMRGQRADPVPTVRLPVPRRIQDAYQRRIGALSEHARTLLAIAAAEDTGMLDVILRAAERLGVPDVLDEVEAGELLRVDEPVVAFRHPLVRAAAYQGIGHARRRTVHRALAEVLSGEHDADRRAWHLAAAALGADEEVARALESTADRARERSGFAAAATALARAAQLSADDAERARRLVAAAQAADMAGRTGLQEALAEQAEPVLTDPGQRAVLKTVRARTAFNAGSLHAAVELLLEAAGLIGGSDVDAAAETLVFANVAAFYSGDLGLARRVHARFEALPGSVDHPQFELVDATTHFLDGSPERALPVLRSRVARLRENPDARIDDLASHAILLGDFGTARDLALAFSERCRVDGTIGLAPMAFAQLSVAELYLGRFKESETAATEGLRVAEDTGQPHRLAHQHGVLAWIAAVRGDVRLCRAHAERNLAHFAVEQVATSAVWGVWALAMLDLGAGRWEEVLDRLGAAARGPGGRQVSAVYFAPDEVEAAARLGTPEAAAGAFERFRRWTEAAGRAWADAVLARCRALLALDGDPEEDFAAAVSCDDRPFEQARSALLYGEWLRRSRRKSEARVQLRHAVEAFGRLGAGVWAERARSELRAAGEAAPAEEAATDLTAQLTGQELQVVRLAATGATNKEIAAKLFLSPKTVGHHLYRAFPKLGVSTRTELARLRLA